jgi:tetratricopeptide (TPR) repeat protein
MEKGIKLYILGLCALSGSMIPVSAQINAEQIVKVGQNALYFDDYVLSIQYFNRAIAAKPYLAQPYFYRAIAKLNLEDYQGAEADASEAIERNPFIPEAYEVRGVARQNIGHFRGAVEDYDHATQLLPNNRNLMFNKALALQQLQERDSAMVAFNQLIEAHPGYANAYVGRGRLKAELADTIGAMADLDHAIELSNKMAYAYVVRASLLMASPKGYEQAESDISEAIRLEPKEGDLYVNRAFLRYSRDDYFGAMADYDYAIQVDPINSAAIYNRGLLRMESRDNDRAIADFSRVLELDPEDYRALYNRILLYSDTRNYTAALRDVNKLIEQFPGLPEALYIRSDIYRKQGKMMQAETDYKKALAMAKALPAKETETAELNQKHTTANVAQNSDNRKANSNQANGQNGSDDTDNELSAESVARRFTALRTIDNDVDLQQDFVNQGIRGRVQDRDRRISLEPMFALGYYSSSTNTATDARSYIKEVDDINATRMLPFLVMVGNKGLTPSDEQMLERHFASVENYNKYISTHEPRAIDFFGRAMDYVTLRNYSAAIADLDKAIALTPDFAMAYFLRGVARYSMLQSSNGITGKQGSANGAVGQDVKFELRSVISDFDRCADLSPRMAYAHYDKGNALVEMGDYTSALAAYRKAIELKPDFGEAYYNLAYVYFQLGNRAEGASNLSKAGELGVVPSYNLLKRMH